MLPALAALAALAAVALSATPATAGSGHASLGVCEDTTFDFLAALQQTGTARGVADHQPAGDEGIDVGLPGLRPFLLVAVAPPRDRPRRILFHRLDTVRRRRAGRRRGGTRGQRDEKAGERQES